MEPDGMCEACLLGAAVLAQSVWHAYWLQQSLGSVFEHDMAPGATSLTHTACLLDAVSYHLTASLNQSIKQATNKQVNQLIFIPVFPVSS